MHIIDQCRDPYGRTSSCRRKLLAQLLVAPDNSLWDLARGLIIRATPIVTLERAVRALQYPTSADQAPDSFTLYRALRCAVDYETNGADAEHGGICRK